MSDETMVHDTDAVLLNLNGKDGWTRIKPDFHRLSGPLLYVRTPAAGTPLTRDEAHAVRDTIDDWLAALERVERVERAESAGPLDGTIAEAEQRRDHEVARAKAEAAREALEARLDGVRQFHREWGEVPAPDDLDQHDMWERLGRLLTGGDA